MEVPMSIGIITINVRDIYSLSEEHSSELNQLLPSLNIELEKYLSIFFNLEVEQLSIVE